METPTREFPVLNHSLTRITRDYNRKTLISFYSRANPYNKPIDIKIGVLI